MKKKIKRGYNPFSYGYQPIRKGNKLLKLPKGYSGESKK